MYICNAIALKCIHYASLHYAKQINNDVNLKLQLRIQISKKKLYIYIYIYKYTLIYKLASMLTSPMTSRRKGT